MQQTFVLELPGRLYGTVRLQLVNAAGQVSPLGKVNVPANGTSIEVEVRNENLKPGIYFLRVTAENKKTEMIKLQLN